MGHQTTMKIILLTFVIGLVHGHGTYVGSRHGVRNGYQTNYQHSLSAPGNQYFQMSPDGSYDFGYDTGSGAYKKEQKTTGGQVVGKYGHSNPDGSYTSVEYEAQSGGPDGSTLYRERYGGYGTSGKGAVQAVQYGHTLPVQPGHSAGTAQTSFNRNTDGSYNFKVQSTDQSRIESGTADGQVQGGYSFIGDDGVQRSVSYTAGQQGFQASGDHLPKDSNTPGAVSAYDRSRTTYNAQNTYRPPSSGSRVAQTYNVHRPVQTAYTGEAVVPDFTLNPDGSYAFGYQTSTQYRNENRSPAGYVTGNHGHTSDDGKRRDYSYVAGAGTGFRVTGDGIPNQPVAGPVHPGRNLVAPTYGTYKGGRISGAYSNGYQSADPKPFSFSYNAGDHGRQETQDENGVVRGSYVVNAADGTQKELTYQADDDGFHIVDEKVVQGAGAPVTGSGPGSYTSAVAPGVAGHKYKQKSIHSGATAY